MKVYRLYVDYDYEGETHHGIYSTEAKALKAAREMLPTTSARVVVEEVTLNGGPASIVFDGRGTLFSDRRTTHPKV